ncbi:hypothetical protein AAMO2058_001682600 [Amorphochlora amoebiformis]
MTTAALREMRRALQRTAMQCGCRRMITHAPTVGYRSIFAFSRHQTGRARRMSTSTASSQVVDKSKPNNGELGGGEEQGGKKEEEKSGIPWFAIFLNVAGPYLFYWFLKRRLREPCEEESTEKISIHRREMEYMIRKTRFKVSDLYWLKEYAEKYFPSGEASPDDWGKFITFIVKELKAHRGEAKTKDDERERPLDDFDALLMYRESPTIEGNSGKISLEELLSGLSVLVVDKVPIKTKKTRKSKGTAEKKEKVKKKPDPWGKFDFAWNLLDKDGDDSLSHEEFILFCQRMIRFGFLRADYLTSQTVSLPNFPPEFVSMDGKMLAKLYWDALNLPEDGVIT